jgi:hypothetical protein
MTKLSKGIIFLLQPSPRKTPACAKDSKSNILTLYLSTQFHENLKKMYIVQCKKHWCAFYNTIHVMADAKKKYQI